MAFNSTFFLFYFLPVFLGIYFLLPGKSKNWFLLLVSTVFYSWGAPGFLPVLVVWIIVDYLLIREMNHREGWVRSLIFWFSVVLNIGVLLYFKYSNFFIEQLNISLDYFDLPPEKWVKIVLPIGISFITFQKLAYTFDVYRKTFKGFRRITDYAIYIFMFPQLLAGPIVRPGQISNQITDRSSASTIDYKLRGFCRFMIGLGKKVLIADILGTTVNSIFSLDPSQLSSGIAWVGAIAYAFQIYFDFSGYSDMAIGLALMLGFRLPENFNNPYLSGSITEFWKRWHITLSLWLRDYIFLPLAYKTSRRLKKEKYAGFRVDKLIYVIAASVTFLLCGFWHGASWTFIVWGAFQGIFLILDRLFLLRLLKKVGKISAILITFFILTVGWVFFRSENLHMAFLFLAKMFSFTGGMNDIWLHAKFWSVLGIAVVFSFWNGNRKIQLWTDRLFQSPSDAMQVAMGILAILLLILCETNLNAAGFSPFIYFRF